MSAMTALCRHLWPVLPVLITCPALAQPVQVQVNRLESMPGTCQMMLVAANPGTDDIETLVLEAVLFDTAGRVAALTLLDLQELPAGRTRVRSYDLAGQDCAALARILINGVADCRAAGPAGCAGVPELTSATALEVVQ